MNRLSIGVPKNYARTIFIIKSDFECSSLFGLNKRKITIRSSHYVEKMGWIEKDRAIALSKNYKIDGVVAKSSTGGLYIRTRHDVKITNNLGVLG
jgi:hypothetical protein